MPQGDRRSSSRSPRATGGSAWGSRTWATLEDLDYEVAVGGFSGDWEDAAALYREWALGQPWASRPLADRDDVPAWLLDSPAPVVIRAAGVLDDSGPSTPNEAFVPYERSLPALDALAETIGGPLMPIVMAWEREGPWVYPEALPPVGGTAAFAAFTRAARDRGWHVGTFCNGTRWVDRASPVGIRRPSLFRGGRRAWERYADPPR